MVIPDKWDIPAKLRARIGKTIGRQRTIQEDGHTIILLHQTPSATEKTRKGACCWVTPDEKIVFQSEAETFDHVFNNYRKKISSLENDYKMGSSAIQYFKVLEEIVPIHFATIRMANALQMARDLLPNSRQVLLWRDETYELQRETEILQTCAKNALDYHQAKSVEDLSHITYELTKTSHRLNMLATFFVPMMAVSALFGMNIPNGFENSESSHFFWGITIFSIAVGLIFYSFFKTPNPPTSIHKPPEIKSPTAYSKHEKSKTH